MRSAPTGAAGRRGRDQHRQDCFRIAGAGGSRAPPVPRAGEELRRGAGAARRRLRHPCRTGARPRRRERRRQVDAHQDHRGRLPARCRNGRGRGPAGALRRRRPGACPAHRHRAPGHQPRADHDGRREPPPQQRADAGIRHHPAARHARAGDAPPAAIRDRRAAGRRGEQPAERPEEDGADHQGGEPQPAHPAPRRADLVADRGRGARGAAADPAAGIGGRRAGPHLALPQRDLRGLGRPHRHARRRGGGRRTGRRDEPAAGGFGDDRAACRDRAPRLARGPGRRGTAAPRGRRPFRARPAAGHQLRAPQGRGGRGDRARRPRG